MTRGPIGGGNSAGCGCQGAGPGRAPGWPPQQRSPSRESGWWRLLSERRGWRRRAAASDPAGTGQRRVWPERDMAGLVLSGGADRSQTVRSSGAFRRRGRWAQVGGREGLLGSPLAPLPRRPPLSRGGGSASCSGVRDSRGCSGNSWSFRFELALPSVGLAFPKRVSPVPPAPRRTVIADRWKSFPASWKRKVAGGI